MISSPQIEGLVRNKKWLQAALSSALTDKRRSKLRNHQAELMAFTVVKPMPVWLDGFIRRTAAHIDNDRARSDGVGQITNASKSDGTEGGQILRLDDLPSGNAADCA